jgi:hypothetical protein
MVDKVILEGEVRLLPEVGVTERERLKERGVVRAVCGNE